MPEINELVKQLGADQETAYKARKTLLEQVTRATAPDADAERKELARALAEQLTARKEENEEEKKKDKNKKPELVHSAPVRVQIACLLSYVAGEPELAVLTETLKDLDVRETARLALDFNSAPEATQGLVAALEDVGPEFRIGVVGALGRRSGDDQALKALQDVAAHESDDRVRIAAVEVLGNFPDASSDAIIQKAARGRYRVQALAARVKLADTLQRAGKTDDAARIYRAISSDGETQHKRAAEIGLKTLA